ncbi:MAG: hypothetical protein HFJ45_05060 [Clostridia bacterium]|nr:hypothetical protein [Clostridia bacterium]
MRKKILRAISLILLVIMLFVLTGCSNDNTNKEEVNNVTIEQNEELQVENLTLEKFKEVMKKRNLNVVDRGTNSQYDHYQVQDSNNSTYYELSVFKDDETALSWWNNSPKKMYYVEEEILEVLKNEEKENFNKYEIVMKNGTIYIDYRENNYFLRATIQNDTPENGQNIAEEIFSELGF